MAFDDLTTHSQKQLIIELIEELQTGKYNHQFEGAADRGRWQIYLIGKEKGKNKEIGNFKDPSQLGPHQEFLFFEEMDLDKLYEEGYIFLEKGQNSLTGLLENKAYNEYEIYKKQKLSDISELEELRSQLNQNQVKILTEIWNYYIQNNQWIPTKVLHHKFGKTSVISAIQPLGGSVVCETRVDTKPRYILSFLGVLITDEGKKLEELLVQYLEFLKNKYLDNAEIEKVHDEEIESALNIDKKISRKVCDAINTSSFLSGGMSIGEKWSVEVPSIIDDFPDIENFLTYLHEKAMEQFDPNEPIDEMERQSYSAQKRKGKMLIGKQPQGEIFYVDLGRIDELRGIKSEKFDLSKLIRLCEELNDCYSNGCFFSVALLTRAIIDHIPPIFGLKNVSEVANNYHGSKSFKSSMQHLHKSSKNIADAHLHVQIRNKETLPNKTQVNFQNDLDVLLSEIVRILK